MIAWTAAHCRQRSCGTIAFGDASPPGQHHRLGGLAMDANTVDAVCNVFLVAIGIIGLLLVRKE